MLGTITVLLCRSMPKEMMKNGGNKHSRQQRHSKNIIRFHDIFSNNNKKFDLFVWNAELQLIITWECQSILYESMVFSLF